MSALGAWEGGEGLNVRPHCGAHLAVGEVFGSGQFEALIQAEDAGNACPVSYVRTYLF